MADTTPRDALMVLGMHRSGTSALAGVLAHLGCATPYGLTPGDENNERGYFESIPIWQLSEAVLAAAGTSWDDWQVVRMAAIDPGSRAKFTRRAQWLLGREFGAAAGAQGFVFKDPRASRLLPFWLEQLETWGATPRCILTHRHPLEVARSLHRRDGFTPEYGLVLWLRYAIEAERATRGRPRVLTSYDRVLTDWRGVAAAIRAVHGIDLLAAPGADPAAVDTFLSPALRHFSGSDPEGADLPPLVERCHAIFERWAASGEDPQDYPRLDAILRLLQEAFTLFGEISAAARLPEEAGARQAMVDGALREMRQTLQAAEDRLARQELELAAATGEIARLRTRLQQGGDA